MKQNIGLILLNLIMLAVFGLFLPSCSSTKFGDFVNENQKYIAPAAEEISATLLEKAVQEGDRVKAAAGVSRVAGAVQLLTDGPVDGKVVASVILNYGGSDKKWVLAAQAASALFEKYVGEKNVPQAVFLNQLSAGILEGLKDAK